MKNEETRAVCMIYRPQCCNVVVRSYEGESNENLKYFLSRTTHITRITAEHHGRYVVLIHDTYPNVRLFRSLLRDDFPSRWLQLLQWPLVSLLGVPDQVEDSLLQN